MMKKWMQVMMFAVLLTTGTGATLEPVEPFETLEPITEEVGEACLNCSPIHSITWGGGGGL